MTKGPHGFRYASESEGRATRQVHAYLVAETGDALMDRDLQARTIDSDWIHVQLTSVRGHIAKDKRQPTVRMAVAPATPLIEMEVVPQRGEVPLMDLPVVMRLGDVVKLMKGGSDAAISAVRGNTGR